MPTKWLVACGSLALILHRTSLQDLDMNRKVPTKTVSTWHTQPPHSFHRQKTRVNKEQLRWDCSIVLNVVKSKKCCVDLWIFPRPLGARLLPTAFSTDDEAQARCVLLAWQDVPDNLEIPVACSWWLDGETVKSVESVETALPCTHKKGPNGCFWYILGIVAILDWGVGG